MGQIIDLPYTAAKKIEIVHKGTARVQIRDIMPAVALEIKQDATTDSQQLYVRFGTFRDLRNATKLLGGVHQSGLPDKRIKAGKINRKKLYRV